MGTLGVASINVATIGQAVRPKHCLPYLRTYFWDWGRLWNISTYDAGLRAPRPVDRRSGINLHCPKSSGPRGRWKCYLSQYRRLLWKKQSILIPFEVLVASTFYSLKYATIFRTGSEVCIYRGVGWKEIIHIFHFSSRLNGFVKSLLHIAPVTLPVHFQEYFCTTARSLATSRVVISS